MLNLLLSDPPITLDVDGKEYSINWSLRPALRIMMAFQDDTLLQAEQVAILLSNIYGEEIPENTEEAVKQAIWFLDCGEESEGEANPMRLYSYEKDASLIYAAFRQTHGIDLSEEKIHWWKFVALFMDVGQETTFTHLVSLRKRVKTGKATKEEIKAYNEMGDLAKIEDGRQRSRMSPERRAKLNEFNRLAEEGKRRRDESKKVENDSQNS